MSGMYRRLPSSVTLDERIGELGFQVILDIETNGSDFAVGRRVKAFDGIARRAELKLDQLDASAVSNRGFDASWNRFEASGAIEKATTAFASTIMAHICFAWPKHSNGPSRLNCRLSLHPLSMT